MGKGQRSKAIRRALHVLLQSPSIRKVDEERLTKNRTNEKTQSN